MKNLNLLFLFTFALALMLLISVSSCENDEIEIKKYSLSGWDMMNENELMLVLDVDPIDADIINVKIYSDIIKNVGPLGGIHSALVNAITPFVFVVSCDMPFASSIMAGEIAKQFLSEKNDILIPRIESYHEPLFAIYSKHLVDEIEVILAKSDGKPIKDLFTVAKTSYYQISDTPLNKRCFANINSVNDLERL